MIDRVCEVVGEAPPPWRCTTSTTRTARETWRRRWAERLPACEPAIVTELGPVLAVHVGAGAGRGLLR